MGFERPGEGLGAGILIVRPPDNAECQMGGTARVTDFHDRDVVTMLIADQRQPRGGQQRDAFFILDECDNRAKPHSAGPIRQASSCLP